MPLLDINDPTSAAVDYPWLKNAVSYILDKGIATRRSLARMPAEMAKGTFAVAGVDSVATLYRLKEAVADTVAKGLTGEDFRKAVADEIELSKAAADCIIRTQTKGAILTQWDATTKKPLVRNAFPYVLYMPTRDGRTRKWHADMAGFVCEVGSEAYEVCLRLQREYNCILPGGLLQGDVTCGIKSNYTGKAIEIELLCGSKIRVTQKHPILTDRGFVQAGELNSSDQLFLGVVGVKKRGRFNATLPLNMGPSKEYQVPTPVEDVFRSLSSVVRREQFRAVGDELHGEAQFLNGDIHVVRADGELLSGDESISTQNIRNLILVESLFGIVGTCHLRRTLGLRHSRPLEPLCIAGRSWSNTVSRQAIYDSISRDLHAEADRIDGTSAVEHRKQLAIVNAQSRSPRTNIRSIRHFAYSGDVYDFETTSGLIVLDGVLIGNCRCGFRSLTEKQAAKYTIKTYADLPASVKAQGY